MSDEGRKPPTTIASMVELLAPTLGVDKSTELVTATAARLGFTHQETFSYTEAMAILRTLGKTEGLIGVVARFAVSRSSSMSLPAVRPASPAPPPHPAPLPRSSPSLPVAHTMQPSELEEILAPTLGADRAHQLVVETTLRLGFGPGPYGREDALALIDSMTAEHGLLDVVAKFARARILLKLK